MGSCCSCALSLAATEGSWHAREVLPGVTAGVLCIGVEGLSVSQAFGGATPGTAAPSMAPPPESCIRPARSPCPNAMHLIPRVTFLHRP